MRHFSKRIDKWNETKGKKKEKMILKKDGVLATETAGDRWFESPFRPDPLNECGVHRKSPQRKRFSITLVTSRLDHGALIRRLLYV